MRKRNSGFTLIEMLVVIAIIAVLVAIVIPTVVTQTEKAREATDLANVRSAYAQVVVAAQTGDRSQGYYDESSDSYVKPVTLKQKKAGWDTEVSTLNIAGIVHDDAHWENDPGEGAGQCDVIYKDGVVRLKWDGDAKLGGFEIDYSSSMSVGKYVLSNVTQELLKFNSSEETEYSKVFKNIKNTDTTTMTLPNGQNVNVVVYNRDYDSFVNLNDRMTVPNTASLIYNRSTGKLSTIVYYDGNTLSSWTVSSDRGADADSVNSAYSSWSEDGNWKDGKDSYNKM